MFQFFMKNKMILCVRIYLSMSMSKKKKKKDMSEAHGTRLELETIMSTSLP